jgi:hypothetical protein
VILNRQIRGANLAPVQHGACSVRTVATQLFMRIAHPMFGSREFLFMAMTTGSVGA